MLDVPQSELIVHISYIEFSLIQECSCQFQATVIYKVTDIQTKRSVKLTIWSVKVCDLRRLIPLIVCARQVELDSWQVYNYLFISAMKKAMSQAHSPFL